MRLRFVSPWYPDYATVHSGIFVAKQVDALRERGHEVFVDVPQIFPAPAGPIPGPVTASMRRLATRSREAMFASEDGVTYVPTPVPARGGPVGRATAVAESMALLSEFRSDTAEIIHAHVAMPTGWAMKRNSQGKPLVVTEHWSGLASLFDEPTAARAYGDLVGAANAFICVSEHLRDLIVQAVGEWAREQIEIVPNIVDLSDIPFRERDRPSFSDWIYIGGLMPHKGVRTLLQSFDTYIQKHDSAARLTLVGQGPLDRWIRGYIASRGLTASVTLAGSVPHHRLGRYLDAADLMVHLSPAETFGIASLEGIGAGLPVVSLRNDGALGAWGDIEDRCGVLLDIEADPATIADSIARLRGDPGRLDAAFGRRVVEERFSAEVVSGRLTTIYERAMA